MFWLVLSKRGYVAFVHVPECLRCCPFASPSGHAELYVNWPIWSISKNREVTTGYCQNGCKNSQPAGKALLLDLHPNCTEISNCIEAPLTGSAQRKYSVLPRRCGVMCFLFPLRILNWVSFFSPTKKGALCRERFSFFCLAQRSREH